MIFHTKFGLETPTDWLVVNNIMENFSKEKRRRGKKHSHLFINNFLIQKLHKISKIPSKANKQTIKTVHLMSNWIHYFIKDIWVVFTICLIFVWKYYMTHIFPPHIYVSNKLQKCQIDATSLFFPIHLQLKYLPFWFLVL